MNFVFSQYRRHFKGHLGTVLGLAMFDCLRMQRCKALAMTISDSYAVNTQQSPLRILCLVPK